MTPYDGARERGFPAARFGHTEPPAEQTAALRKAKILELVNIAYMSTAIAVVFLPMGSS